MSCNVPWKEAGTQFSLPPQHGEPALIKFISINSRVCSLCFTVAARYGIPILPAHTEIGIATMRTIPTILAYVAGAHAAAIASRTYPPSPGPWTAGVWRPPTGDGAPIFFGVGINANNGYFWLGKDPTAYCPPDVEGLDCSAFPGSRTVFTGGNDTVSLDVGVPGGQQGRRNLPPPPVYGSTST